jgi:hypothetical protein
LVAIAVFYGAHFTDIDKFSVFLAFFIQNFLFIFLDSDFNSNVFVQSCLLSLIFIAVVKLDLVSSRVRRSKTVFL